MTGLSSSSASPPFMVRKFRLRVWSPGSSPELRPAGENGVEDMFDWSTTNSVLGELLTDCPWRWNDAVAASAEGLGFERAESSEAPQLASESESSLELKGLWETSSSVWIGWFRSLCIISRLPPMGVRAVNPTLRFLIPEIGPRWRTFMRLDHPVSTYWCDNDSTKQIHGRVSGTESLFIVSIPQTRSFKWLKLADQIFQLTVIVRRGWF
jgi:hypothetical protein